MLGKLVLKHTNNNYFSKTLQHVSRSAAEDQQITSMIVATLNSMCSDDQFDLFGDIELSVSEAQLPWQRKLPRRYDDGSSSGDFHSTPKTLCLL